MVMKNGDENRLLSPFLITSSHHQYSSPVLITSLSG
jgi:hypothetical protein